ncbi:MAG: DNA polymerase III subunit delta [Armatimonadota bacterium]|nr:DNA polymerase III subunit delta [Armatimonadota bacterium]MDR5697965.1 DNA polymerase III subunit delta [Armatimonadota bacterium]
MARRTGSTVFESHRVHLLLGEEDWLVDEAVHRLVDAHLPPEERSLNLDRLDAGETDVVQIITRADTMSFFGSARVVVVRGLERLPIPSQERLAAYLEQGPPPSVLVLVARSLDRRRRLYATLRKVARIQEFEPLNSQAAAAWAMRRTQSLDKRLEPEAARALVDVVGTGLRDLAGEIDKLVMFTGDRETIRTDDVREVAYRGVQVSVFAIVDAVGEGDVGHALRTLDTLLSSENPIGLLALLAGHFRALLATGALAEQHAAPDRVRAALGNRAWLYGRYRDQIRRLRGVDLAGLYREIERTDLALKNSPASARAALEGLVVRLCGAGWGARMA